MHQEITLFTIILKRTKHAFLTNVFFFFLFELSSIDFI